MSTLQPNDVLSAVALECGISVAEIIGTCRSEAIAFARGLSARIIHDVCGYSYPQLAQCMCRRSRSHSTFVTARQRADYKIAAHERIKRGDGVLVPASDIAVRAYLALGYATNGRRLHLRDNSRAAGSLWQPEIDGLDIERVEYEFDSDFDDAGRREIVLDLTAVFTPDGSDIIEMIDEETSLRINAMCSEDVLERLCTTENAP